MFKIKLRRLFDYLKVVNVYVATNEDTIETQQKQIIATRVFLILFIVSLISLVGYGSLSLQLTTVYIESPSQSTFERLYSIYPNTLVCPCSQTSIQVDKFVYINVSYHQICSSMFVEDEWISSLSHLIPQLFYLLDIRRMISSQLQILASQCQSSQVAMTDALTILGSNQLFIPTMLSRDTLYSQIDIIINETIKDTIAEQNQSRRLIQTIDQQNQLVSALGSNFMYANGDNNGQEYYLVRYLTNWTYPPTLGFAGYTDSELCSCIDSSNCTYPSGIYSSLTGIESFYYQGIASPPTISSIQIPGLYTGCTPLDASMQSTLECFYRNDCLSILFNTTNIKQLNSSIVSKFSIETKIEDLIENLFIENWSSEKDFGLFFKECQPNKCTYSYNARGNLVFIVTTIFSLIGGLFSALKIVAYVLVSIFKIIKRKFKEKYSQTPSISGNDQEISSRRNIFHKIREQIFTFNLFKHSYNDEHGRRNEILSTRIYILLMIISIVIIIFYALLIEHTLIYHIKTPSLYDYRELIDKYPSLTCECKQITTDYPIFMSLNPIFHQLCSSIYMSNVIPLQYGDVRKTFILGKFILRIAVSSYYSSGRLMCTLVRETSDQAIKTYLQTLYVSTHLTPEDEFMSRINASVKNFEVLAPATFNHLLELIRYTTQGNQLLTGSFTNAKFYCNRSLLTEESMLDILWINPNNKSCSCGMSLDSCAISYDQFCNYTYIPWGDAYDTTCYNPIPGLTISCYVIDGLLVSNSQCFYDIECVMTIIGTFARALNISTEVLLPLFLLNKDPTSRFTVNSSASDFLNFLGIENWNEEINYSSYYYNCKPTNCFYTITKHFHIPTIVTIVIGLIGGVSVILRLIIPLIINFIRRRQRLLIDNTRIAWKESLFHRLIKALRQLNFFKSSETNQSPEIQHTQIISTRLYIILWIITVIFLSIYTGLDKKTIVVRVNSPSIYDVKQFQSENLNEFICSCSKITIPFGTFTSFNFMFHQICSSNFISDEWLEGLFNFDNEQSVNRAMLGSHFQFLRLFCRSSNKSLLDTSEIFYANQFISVNLLTENEFFIQSGAFIQEFKTKTISSFRRNLGLIVDITLGNQLMSIYETNWHFIIDPEGRFPIYAKSRSYESGNCSCGSSQALYCIDPLVVGDNITTIPGMWIGCLPITALRLSTLQCFYDQVCLDEVKKALNLQNISLVALNSTQLSRFSMNITSDNIIDNLMLENWTRNVDYSGYFDECNPYQCTYSIIEKNYVLVIFTTLLGLYGGLTITLDFIAPFIVKIGQKIYNKYQSHRRTTPEVS